MQFYSIIGPRLIPSHYQILMKTISDIFEDDSYILRTRGREGFELSGIEGIKYPCNKIIIPGDKWTQPPPNEAYDIAWDHTPKWLDLTERERKQRAYIIQVLLGHDLRQKSKFLLTYTEDDWTKTDVLFAIRVSKAYNIKVFDIGEMCFFKLWHEILNMGDK